jgi:hypothetical protein
LLFFISASSIRRVGSYCITYYKHTFFFFFLAPIATQLLVTVLLHPGHPETVIVTVYGESDRMSNDDDEQQPHGPTGRHHVKGAKRRNNGIAVNFFRHVFVVVLCCLVRHRLEEKPRISSDGSQVLSTVGQTG